MRIDVRRASVGLSGLVVAASLTVAGQRSASVPPADATAKIDRRASGAASLDDAGRAKLQFRFDDQEQRPRWSNLPSPMFERKGIRLGDLTPPQRAAVTNLLQTAFSADGYRKVTEIMRGDEVLRTNGGGRGGGGRGPGGRGGPAFGQDEYYLAFLGPPSVTAPWMLQFGGHHLAINLTLGGAQASMTRACRRRSQRPTRSRARSARSARKTTRRSR